MNSCDVTKGSAAAKPSKISLAIIVKPTPDEAKKLDRALTSVKGVFDEIVITQAGKEPCKEVEVVCEKHNATVDFFSWIDDFAAARNHNFAQATGDWIMWMDADDVLVNAGKIPEYVRFAEEKDVDGYAMLYHYGYDKDGNLTEKHWKTQLIKNDGHAKWVGAIHEDLIAQRAVNWVSIKDVYRVHKSTREENASHFERNLSILERERDNNPDEPRNYIYLARTYLGLDRYEDSILAAREFLQRSDWRQERYEAKLLQGEAFMKLDDLESALLAYQDAILEAEMAPDAYIYKARVYILQKEWKNALTSLEIAGTLKNTQGTLIENPTLYQKDLPSLAALCLIHLNRPQEAVQMAKLATSAARSPEAEELLATATRLANWQTLATYYEKIGMHLYENGDTDAVARLLDTAPKDIADYPKLIKLRHTVTEPRVWPKHSVAFFCGPTVEPWDGNSVHQGGIGGSETAVIELAKRFAAAGWEATVYNWCDAPADGVNIDGVTYRNYWQIDARDTFDVLVLWRVPAYLDTDWNARKLVVDMHDVSNANEWIEKRIAKVDHVFVKSEYHKSLYPTVPHEKFVVVGNGIDLSRFNGNGKKSKNRFVYTSTPNRGLEHILDMWPDIRNRIPDAELHVYYGWKTFAESHKHDATKLAWMRQMQQKLAQPGITNHGRVGQQKLASDLLESSIWLYPTDFPEIHCITALEMQAANVYPITTGFAALAETQQSGAKIPGDPADPKWQQKFIEEIVFAYENPDTITKDLAKGKAYAQSCSWDNISNVWIKTLK